MIPSAVRVIFLLPPTAFFLHEIGRDPFRQQGGDFSQHIGWELGKFRHGGKKSSLEMGHGQKNIPAQLLNSCLQRADSCTLQNRVYTFPSLSTGPVY
jgi:hypothetical protein